MCIRDSIEQVWSQLNASRPGESLFDRITAGSGFGPQGRRSWPGGKRPVATDESARPQDRMLSLIHISKDFARNVVTLGRFPSCPDIGNLETGVLISDGSGSGSDWEVESVRISLTGQSAVWVARSVGLVKGGVAKQLTFALESETEWSPMALQRKKESLRELARTDPVRWLEQKREGDRLLSSCLLYTSRCV